MRIRIHSPASRFSQLSHFSQSFSQLISACSPLAPLITLLFSHLPPPHHSIISHVCVKHFRIILVFLSIISHIFHPISVQHICVVVRSLTLILYRYLQRIFLLIVIVLTSYLPKKHLAYIMFFLPFNKCCGYKLIEFGSGFGRNIFVTPDQDNNYSIDSNACKNYKTKYL